VSTAWPGCWWGFERRVLGAKGELAEGQTERWCYAWNPWMRKLAVRSLHHTVPTQGDDIVDVIMYCLPHTYGYWQARGMHGIPGSQQKGRAIYFTAVQPWNAGRAAHRQPRRWDRGGVPSSLPPPRSLSKPLSPGAEGRVLSHGVSSWRNGRSAYFMLFVTRTRGSADLNVVCMTCDGRRQGYKNVRVRPHTTHESVTFRPFITPFLPLLPTEGDYEERGGATCVKATARK
jgi:hypothetical protein